MNKIINILVVEDDKLDQIQAERAFKQKDLLFKLHCCSDGEEALNLLMKAIDWNGKLPDIILLDLDMPKMNGFEFIAELRKREALSGIKIFILSNSDRECERCEQLGISGYILKPLKFNNPSMDTISLMVDLMNL